MWCIIVISIGRLVATKAKGGFVAGNRNGFMDLPTKCQAFWFHYEYLVRLKHIIWEWLLTVMLRVWGIKLSEEFNHAGMYHFSFRHRLRSVRFWIEQSYQIPLESPSIVPSSPFPSTAVPQMFNTVFPGSPLMKRVRICHHCLIPDAANPMIRRSRPRLSDCFETCVL